MADDIKQTDPAKGVPTITFQDLFSLEDIQRLQDEFSLATGVATIITSPDGIPITQPSNFCRLCKDIIRNTEKGLKNCFKSDAIIGAPSKSGPTIQHCKSSGLLDAGAAIVVEEKHLANWMIGQVRDEQYSEEQALAYAREIGVDASIFLSALRDVPCIERRQFENIVSMLSTLANQLSSTAYQNIKLNRLIQQLKTTEETLHWNQNELSTSQHRLRVVVSNLPQTMLYQVELYPDGRRQFTYVSDNIEKLNGISKEEALRDASTIYNGIHPEDQPALILLEKKALAEMKTFRCQTRYIKPDGTQRWFQLASSPRAQANGSVVWDGFQLDITEQKHVEEEQKRLEKLVRQTQKIEAIGQLAGGIAHDLNNMLAPIIGYGELLLLKMEEEDSNRKAVGSIIEAGTRARDLVRQLLAFGRKQTMEMGSIDLNAIAVKCEGLLQRVLREDIELVSKRAVGLPTIMADKAQLEQVLMNLAMNGQDAMPDGGKLLIETGRTEISRQHEGLKIGAQPGHYLTLAVTDSGAGIPKEIEPHIFEPFFSTKKAKGSGLGLSTVYGIIIQHGGSIAIDSAPGKGSRFTVYLPVSEEQSLTANSDHSDSRREQKTVETILLAEDNLQVLEMTESILKTRGYIILSASNGREALDLAAAHPGHIDLLLTDVIMPGLNGKDLFLELQQRRPDIKVCYMSGYADDIISHQGVLDEGISFIQKPFALADLIEKIRAVLNS